MADKKTQWQCTCFTLLPNTERRIAAILERRVAFPLPASEALQPTHETQEHLDNFSCQMWCTARRDTVLRINVIYKSFPPWKRLRGASAHYYLIGENRAWLDSLGEGGACSRYSQSACAINQPPSNTRSRLAVASGRRKQLLLWVDQTAFDVWTKRI